MTHLNIQQGSNAEIVPMLVIDKLYEVALSVPEPLNGEVDAAYISGHILTANTYKDYVDYLAGTVGEGDNGIVTSIRQNAAGRFLNLTIDVTNGYYIPFEDENMLSYLLNLGIGSNGAITTVQAAAVTRISGLTNTTVTKFNELKYFTNITKIDNSGFRNWTALEEIDLINITSLGTLSFFGCTALNTIILPNIQTVDQLSFGGRNDNQQNRVIDCGSNLTSWSGDQFGNDAKVTLILRGSSIPSMVDNFYNRGYWDTTIYVPRDMIALYKADTDGWGRIQGRDGREVFYALEDSIYADPNWYQQQ